MRRKDREETREAALAILDGADFGVMATVDTDGRPYCIPLSFARDAANGGEWLYFHSALSGHKLDNLKNDPSVCISFTGKVSFPQDDFTVIYESALVFGRAEEITADEEKIFGLNLISRRFTPGNMAAFDETVQKSLWITGVWKIHIDEISGKRRKMTPPPA